ncbi:MAG TPA: hypothetical protein VI408_10685 [Gaiellaceae bacterium]
MGVNWWRLRVVPHPDTVPYAAAFDDLIEATPPGGEVAYDLPQPKWWFLHHLTRRGFLLHGTNRRELTEMRTRATFDAHGAPIDAAFASDDALWPLYFAVVDRDFAQSYINWCEHPGNGTSRYLFSIGSDPRDPRSWSDGTIYILDGATFQQTPGSREFTSRVPVSPRARLHVTPADFPLKDRTRGHRRGDSVRKVSILHALRL